MPPANARQACQARQPRQVWDRSARQARQARQAVLVAMDGVDRQVQQGLQNYHVGQIGAESYQNISAMVNVTAVLLR